MSKLRRGIYFTAALVLGVGAIIAVSSLFPIVDLIEAVQQRVMQWGTWSGICYPLLFALCNLLLLPGGILSVGSGFFFGLWWGFAIVLAGNIVSAAMAFVITRWVARPWLSRKLASNSMLRVLEPAVERQGWKIIFLSQLHPLFPTSLINYLYGLTGVRFGTYMIWATLGRAPGLFLYAYVGTLGQYGLNMARGRTHPREVEYWIWGSAFVASGLLLAMLSRLALIVLRQKGRDSAGATLVRPAQIDVTSL
jgi:uncharacterized membrane protein YdjX (TVP38/TMEM64 family)